MKFCQSHWDALKKAIQEQGMGNLIAKSGEALVSRLNKSTPVPEPLIEAHNMILSRAIEYLPHIMGYNPEDPQNHFCPLCEANKFLPPHPETQVPCAEAWISTLTKYLRTEYIKEGWIKEN